MRIAPLILISALPAASSASAPATNGAEWPQRFFLGETRGEGVLKIVLQAPHAVLVKGKGRLGEGGLLILEQRVEEEGKPARNRVWNLHGTPQGAYSGTLSDASSPVAGEAQANRLHLKFRIKGGYSVDQQLVLQPDGATALNHMQIKKFGLTVATLEETIRRVGK